ncbi:MAG: orotidine 5'-phosphate decarboxylase [Candidatus Bathyarchaeota archaeon]|nr:orotidine 5'-phosphate decarboxylase [Candidatus Bathyarchaeota archaeon]
MSFKLRMEQASRRADSRVVLALDLSPNEPEKLFLKAEEILEKTHSHICGVKLNHHLTLPLGLFDKIGELLAQARDYGLPTIMDCKVNDIGNTNRIIAEYYFKAGFDAVIANPIVGWEEGLQPVFETARLMNKGVILLVYMSHKGALEGYGRRVFMEETGQPVFQYKAFARKALQWNADGVVVGATYPEKIREVHSILGEKVPIYSPGIGAQGGGVETAVKGGAKYLIVGRDVTLAEDPARVAEKLKASAKYL